MKTLLKKVIPVILSIMMLTVFSTTAMAADISPRNTLINTVSCSIKDNNNDTAVFKVNATAASSVNQIDVSVEVQVKGFWGYSEDQTLSDTFYKSYGTYSDTISIDSSKSYRRVVTYTAYSSSTSETITKTSSAT